MIYYICPYLPRSSCPYLDSRYGEGLGRVIEQSNISETVAGVIKARIAEDKLPFGHRLHIRNLAQELGVSPTPVREALNRLIAEGLAESVPRRGIFVANPSPRDIAEMFETRLCLELYMAEAVVWNATPEHIDRLRELARQIKSPHLQSAEIRRRAFHELFAEISGNRTLARLHRQMMGLLGVLFLRAMKRGGAPARDQHGREEEEICGAIEARDVAALREAIEVHIHNLQAQVFETNLLEEAVQARPETVRSLRK